MYGSGCPLLRKHDSILMSKDKEFNKKTAHSLLDNFLSNNLTLWMLTV